MDEELTKMMEMALDARRRGVPVERINASIQQFTGLDNLPALITKARGGQTASETAAAEPEESGVGGVTKALAIGAQGASAGFAGPLMGLGERVGVLPEGTREGFEFARDSARKENPLASGVGEFATMMVGAPGLGALAGAKGALAAGRAAGGLARGTGVASRLGGGAAQIAATAGTGAAAGAAEGALMGVGDALDEDRTSMPEILQSAGGGAALGGATGLLFGGLGAAAGRGMSALKRPGGAGGRLRSALDEIAETTDDNIPAFRDRMADLKTQKNEAYRDALDGTVPLPVGGAIMDNPVMVDALRRNGGRAGKKFISDWNAYMRAMNTPGVRLTGPPPRLPASAFDDMRQALKNVSDQPAIAGLGGGRGVSTTSVNEARDALAKVDEFAENIPGFSEAQALARLEGTQTRALDAGIKGWSQPAGEARQAFEALGDNAEARDAFRLGMLRNIRQRLGERPARVKAFVDDVLDGDEAADKLRVALGDDGFNAFLRDIQSARTDFTVADLTDKLIKYGGFIALGSSLAGNAAVDLLLGG